jgi:hypothetical protein
VFSGTLFTHGGSVDTFENIAGRVKSSEETAPGGRGSEVMELPGGATSGDHIGWVGAVIRG